MNQPKGKLLNQKSVSSADIIGFWHVGAIKGKELKQKESDILVGGRQKGNVVGRLSALPCDIWQSYKYVTLS